MKLTLGLSMLFLLGACSSSQDAEKPYAAAELPQTLDIAMMSSFRTEENKQRDQYQHPLETLKFFGLKPDMTVVEVYPGTGWYTEIIAPYVAEKGKYIMAVPSYDANKPKQIDNDMKIKLWMNNHPEAAKSMSAVEFDVPEKTQIAPENSVDMIVSFENVHIWRAQKNERKAFNAFFKALKPGGILGVVAHRELEDRWDPEAKRGYIREKDLVNFGLRAGFLLVATSEINANKKDTKNHPAGVHSLPPTLALGDQDRAKYLAIGESDRLTLKFIKPKK